jgi:hypothetical protein
MYDTDISGWHVWTVRLEHEKLQLTQTVGQACTQEALSGFRQTIGLTHRELWLTQDRAGRANTQKLWLACTEGRACTQKTLADTRRGRACTQKALADMRRRRACTQ